MQTHSSLFRFYLQHIRDELAQQEHQHHEHHGADELCALFQGEVRADDVADDVADGAGDAHRKDHQPAAQIGEEAGVVAGEVEHFGVAVGCAQVKAHQAGESDDGKGPGARPHHAVVQTDAKADAQGQQGLFQIQGAVVPVLVREVATPQDDDCRDGQDDEHHHLQHLIAEHQDDVCAQGTARKASDGGEDADLEVHRAVLEETGRGERRAAGGAEFVGGVSIVRRQAREEIGRQLICCQGRRSISPLPINTGKASFLDFTMSRLFLLMRPSYWRIKIGWICVCLYRLMDWMSDILIWNKAL